MEKRRLCFRWVFCELSPVWGDDPEPVTAQLRKAEKCKPNQTFFVSLGLEGLCWALCVFKTIWGCPPCAVSGCRQHKGILLEGFSLENSIPGSVEVRLAGVCTAWPVEGVPAVRLVQIIFRVPSNPTILWSICFDSSWRFCQRKFKTSQRKRQLYKWAKSSTLVIPARTKISREEIFYLFVNIIPSTVLQAPPHLTSLGKGKSPLYKFLFFYKLNASSLPVLSPFAPFCANISVTSCKFNVFSTTDVLLVSTLQLWTHVLMF